MYIYIYTHIYKFIHICLWFAFKYTLNPKVCMLE